MVFIITSQHKCIYDAGPDFQVYAAENIGFDSVNAYDTLPAERPACPRGTAYICGQNG